MSLAVDYTARRFRLVERRSDALGISVDADGVCLGPCVLIERRAGRFVRRGIRALDLILDRAYGGAGDPAGLHAALEPIVRKLDQGDLAGAMVRAVLLGLPDLADEAVRLRLEDLDLLLKTGFDPDQPRDADGRWGDSGSSAVLLGQAFEAARTHPLPDGVQMADASGAVPLQPSMGPWPRLLDVGDAVSGTVTIYGVDNDRFAGKKMANGQIMDPDVMTAAVRPNNIPIGATVSVTLKDDPTKSIVVPVTDNGMVDRTASRAAGAWVPWPGTEDHVIDLSRAAYRALVGDRNTNPQVTVRILSVPQGHYHYSPLHQ